MILESIELVVLLRLFWRILARRALSQQINARQGLTSLSWTAGCSHGVKAVPGGNTSPHPIWTPWRAPWVGPHGRVSIDCYRAALELAARHAQIWDCDVTCMWLWCAMANTGAHHWVLPSQGSLKVGSPRLASLDDDVIVWLGGLNVDV